MRFIQNLATGLAVAGLAVATPTPTEHEVSTPVLEKRTTYTYGLATYWGQPGQSVFSLTDVCNGASYSHVNLAFLTDYFSTGGWPALNLDRLGPSNAQVSAKAGNLVDGTSLNAAILKCQANGKKVLLSVGGSTGTGHFTAAKYATAAATNLFNLFLGGSNATTKAIRPFGTVVLDGIDLGKKSLDHSPYDDCY